MSKLNVNLDYIKLSQYIKVIDCYMSKVKAELDKAAMEQRNEWFCDSRDCYRYFNDKDKEDCVGCKRFTGVGEDRFMTHIQKYGY